MHDQDDVTRRGFLAGTAGAAALAATAGAAGTAQAASPHRRVVRVAPSRLPSARHSGIDHIVVVMMENRSFDHFLGWLPGANGQQGGLSYIDRYGVPHATHHLSDYQGCSHPDPDHSYEGGRIEFNGEKCDGWLKAGENDRLAISYYTQPDLAFLGRAATACR